MAGSTLNPEFDYVFKILLVGDSGVGKSSMLSRFTEDKFEDNAPTTMGVDSKPKTVTVDGKRVKLNVWDTAGQERMGFLTSSYYRGAHGIIIVFDITNANSYQNVTNWLGEIERYAYDSALKILVGNKSDLDSREVRKEEAEAYAKNELSIDYFETSAKEGNNIEEAFLRLAEQMKKRKDGMASSSSSRPSGSNTLSLDQEPSKKPSKKGCII
jgi:Ras-related protein Rab-1A